MWKLGVAYIQNHILKLIFLKVQFFGTAPRQLATVVFERHLNHTWYFCNNCTDDKLMAGEVQTKEEFPQMKQNKMNCYLFIITIIF